MTSPSLQNFKYLFKQLGSTETRYIKDLNKCKYSKYNKPCKPVFIFIRMFANWLTFIRTTYLLPSNCVLWTEPVQDKTVCLGSQQSFLFTCAYTRCLQPTFAVYQALGQDSVKANCEYWRHWLVWASVHTEQVFFAFRTRYLALFGEPRPSWLLTSAKTNCCRNAALVKYITL